MKRIWPFLFLTTFAACVSLPCPAAMTYRTTDNEQWGAGKGTPLTKEEGDANFWTTWKLGEYGYGEHTDAREYGMDPSNSATDNDTGWAAFKAAVQAGTTPGFIYFGPGEWWFGNMTWEAGYPLTMVGCGAAPWIKSDYAGARDTDTYTLIKHVSDGSGVFFALTGAEAFPGKIKIADLTFAGAAATTTVFKSYGVTRGLTVENVLFAVHEDATGANIRSVLGVDLYCSFDVSFRHVEIFKWTTNPFTINQIDCDAAGEVCVATLSSMAGQEDDPEIGDFAVVRGMDSLGFNNTWSITAVDVGSDTVTFNTTEHADAWAGTTRYNYGDLVTDSGNVYECLVSHLSTGTFANDLSSGYWQILADELSPWSAATLSWNAGFGVGLKVWNHPGDAKQAAFNQSVFDNVVVRNFDINIQVGETNEADYFSRYINSVVFKGGASEDGFRYGIFLGSGVEAVRFEGMHIETANVGVYSRYGARNWNFSGSKVHNCNIAFDLWADGTFPKQGSRNIVIEGNLITDCQKGLRIQGGAGTPVVRFVSNSFAPAVDGSGVGVEMRGNFRSKDVVLDGTLWNDDNVDTSAHEFKYRIVDQLGGINETHQRYWVLSTDAAITDHGDANVAGSFAYANANRVGDNAKITLPGDYTFVVSTAVTVTAASNLSFEFEPGAMLQPASGVAITFNGGYIDAGPWQIFDLSEGGTVDLDGLRNQFVDIAWFGDDVTGYQAAIDAAGNIDTATVAVGECKQVMAGPRVYDLASTSLTLRKCTHLIGTAAAQPYSGTIYGGTKFTYAGTGAAMTTDTSSAELQRDIVLQDFSIALSNGTNSTGILLDYATQFVVDRVVVDGFMDYGIRFTSSHDGAVRDSKFLGATEASGTGVKLELDASTDVFSGQIHFDRCQFHDALNGIHIFRDAGRNVLSLLKFTRCHARTNGQYGLYIEGPGATGSITFDNCQWEANGDYDVYVEAEGQQGISFINNFTNNSQADHENEWMWYLLGRNISVENSYFLSGIGAVYSYGIYVGGQDINIDSNFFNSVKRSIYVAPAAERVVLGANSFDSTAVEGVTTFERYSLDASGDGGGWGVSAAGTCGGGGNEYYFIEDAVAGAPNTAFTPNLDSFSDPDFMLGPDASDDLYLLYDEGTVGSLTAGQFGWGCTATDPCQAGGYNTIYICLRGAEADPEALTDSVFGVWRNVTWRNDRIEAGPSFDLSSSLVQDTLSYGGMAGKNDFVKEVEIYYTEATSADAGVVLKAGTKEDDDHFLSTTSEVSAPAHSMYLYEPDANSIHASGEMQRLIFKSAGGKTGDGVIQIRMHLVPWKWYDDNVD